MIYCIQKVYCGHEYTISNLKYGKHVEPDNMDIVNKIQWCEQQRSNDLPTVPGTIGEEKKCNPFMRVQHVNVQTFAGTLNDNVQTMKSLRDKKNSFRG